MRPLRRTTPRSDGDEPGGDLERGRLPGSVGAEQREDLAPPHLEADVEEHLDVPVAEVDVVELQDRDGLGIRGLAPVLLLLLLELEDDEGEVVADEVRAADDHEAADDRGGDHDDEHGGSRAEGLVESGREHGATGGPDEEEVDGADRAGQAAEVVRARPR